MADPEHDQDVSRRYRELGRNEPPPELDAKIRAEARRAVVTHPAPLVVPTGRSRWYFPVAAAAVIVLAVAVTWHMDREQMDSLVLSQGAPESEKKERSFEELPQAAEERSKQNKPQKVAPLAKRVEKPAASAPFTPEPPAAVAQAPAAAAQAPAESATGALAVPRDREQAYGSREDRARQERPSAVAPPPAPQERPSAVAPAPTPQARPSIAAAAPAPREPPTAVETTAPQARSSAATQAPQRELQRDSVTSAVQGMLAPESPEQWLERIARLRQEGRHDEADKALAEFRKRYQDYKIPAAMLERVEKK